jgi:hypothetical protein
VSSEPPLPDPGLCATCRHAAIVRGARYAFWMCRLSATDPTFDRYPRLPILQCRGYQRGPRDEPEPPALNDEGGRGTP